MTNFISLYVSSLEQASQHQPAELCSTPLPNNFSSPLPSNVSSPDGLGRLAGQYYSIITGPANTPGPS